MAALRPLILRYSARARTQLVAIQEHILGEGNAGAAVRAGRGIREAAELLTYFPYAGRDVRLTGTREWVVRQLPYVVVYEVVAGDPGEIMILGVFHCRQNRDR